VETLIYLDTHLVAWLYGGRTDLLPAPVRALLSREPLRVSPMVLLELQYLFEIGKTKVPGGRVIGDLEGELGLSVCDQPFERVVSGAIGIDWTRDPFDRLIVSQAAITSSTLVTKDRNIRANYGKAYWQE
jgi:PIN domain nuclease of toxin-antitoxin system